MFIFCKESNYFIFKKNNIHYFIDLDTKYPIIFYNFVTAYFLKNPTPAKGFAGFFTMKTEAKKYFIFFHLFYLICPNSLIFVQKI